MAATSQLDAQNFGVQLLGNPFTKMIGAAGAGPTTL